MELKNHRGLQRNSSNGTNYRKLPTQQIRLVNHKPVVKKAIPYSEMQLYKGLTNWCGCGVIDLYTKDFICHTKEHHHGIIQKNSQLNRPPWLDLIHFLNDEIEELFCFTDETLDDFVK